MSNFQRRLTVFALCTLFSTPILADDGYMQSVWQEIWGNFIAWFSGDTAEGGSVYVPSGGNRPGGGDGFSAIFLGDEGGSVYVPSGKPLNGSNPNSLGEPQNPEGGSVYVPSG